MILFKQSITNFTTTLTDLYPVYNPSTTYASGNKVVYSGLIWELIPSTATGKTPEDGSLYWIKYGVSNVSSIIDLRTTTKSSKIGGFYIEFPISYTNDILAIGFFSAYRTRVEALDSVGNVLKSYYDQIQSINENVYDYYDYMYSDYTTSIDRTILLKLSPIGVNMRITFEAGVGFVTPSCGFVMYGESIDMGKTLFDVNFKYNSYSIRKTDGFGIMTIDKRAVQKLTDFITTIDKDKFVETQNKIANLYDEFVCIALDETKTDEYSFASIGVIQDCSLVFSEFDMNNISWSITEAV